MSNGKPRRDKWFKLVELAALISPQHPRLTGLRRESQRKYIWRLVRALELRDGCAYMKRAGGLLYVSRRALEALMPTDERVLTSLERDLADVAQIQRHMRRQLNGYGARILVLEKKQQLTHDYLRDMAAADETQMDASETKSAAGSGCFIEAPARDPTRVEA